MQGRALSRAALPDPISLSPSNLWEGNDGRWSTFNLSLGTPQQDVRVLISGSGSLSTILPQACANGTLGNCKASRGSVFRSDASSTWKLQDGYNVSYEVGGSVYFGGPGSETLKLPLANSSRLELDDFSVVGITTSQPDLGSIGLRPTLSSDDDYMGKSLLTTLKESGKIPSLSWAFTAGAFYRNAVASCVLGGYDTSLMRYDLDYTPYMLNDMMFDIVDDYAGQFRDLPVVLSSISTQFNASDPSSSTEIFSLTTPALIDIGVSYLWLTEQVCAAFEHAFGIVWNETTELYHVSATRHQELWSRNPTLSFIITNNNGSAQSSMALPYQGFVFNNTNTSSLNAPIPNPIFALKRATLGYSVLGRVLFQDSYLIVDCERNKFAVLDIDDRGAESKPNITSILPLEEARLVPSATSQPTSTDSISRSEPQSRVEIIGGVVGAVLFVVLLGVGITFWWLRRRRTNPTRQEEFEGKPELPAPDAGVAGIAKIEVGENQKPDPELDGISIKELPTVYQPGELPIDSEEQELQGDSARHEISASVSSQVPSGRSSEREMQTEPQEAAELP